MSEAEAENRTEVTVQGIEGTVSGTWAKRRHTPLADLKASAVDIRVLQDPAADFKVKKTDEDDGIATQKAVDGQYKLLGIIKGVNKGAGSHALAEDPYKRGLRVNVDLATGKFALSQNGIKVIENATAEEMADVVRGIKDNWESASVVDKFIFNPATLEDRTNGPAYMLNRIKAERDIVDVKHDDNIYTVTSKPKKVDPDTKDDADDCDGNCDDCESYFDCDHHECN